MKFPIYSTTFTLLILSLSISAQTYKVPFGMNQWAQVDYKSNENIWNFHWPEAPQSTPVFLKESSKDFFPNPENCQKYVVGIIEEINQLSTNEHRDIYKTMIRGDQKTDYFSIRWSLSPFTPKDENYNQHIRTLIKEKDGNHSGLPLAETVTDEFELKKSTFRLIWDKEALTHSLGTEEVEAYFANLEHVDKSFLLNGTLTSSMNFRDFACDLLNNKVKVIWNGEVQASLTFPTYRRIQIPDLNRLYLHLRQNSTLPPTEKSKAYLLMGFQLERGIQNTLTQVADSLTEQDFINLYASVFDRKLLQVKSPLLFHPQQELHRFESYGQKNFTSTVESSMENLKVSEK